MQMHSAVLLLMVLKSSILIVCFCLWIIPWIIDELVRIWLMYENSTFRLPFRSQCCNVNQNCREQLNIYHFIKLKKSLPRIVVQWYNTHCLGYFTYQARFLVCFPFKHLCRFLHVLHCIMLLYIFFVRSYQWFWCCPSPPSCTGFRLWFAISSRALRARMGRKEHSSTSFPVGQTFKGHGFTFT